MKVNFKQPKYVIPLIILPFLILAFFIFGGKINAGEKVTTKEKFSGLNTNMPGVDSNISKSQIKDKFSAYQQAFKNARDQSAMADVDNQSAKLQGIEYQSSYSVTDLERLESKRKMDSLNQVLKFGQSKIQSQLEKYNNSPQFLVSEQKNENSGYLPKQNSSGEVLLKKLLNQKNENPLQNKISSIHESENPESYDNQMRVFRDQMKYMDSMQRSNSGGEMNKERIKNNSFTKEFNPSKDTSFKPLPIRSSAVPRQAIFNTVRDFEGDNETITAIIDQDIKATLGSRIRIRLLKDMFVGNYLLHKGSYLYGFVTGFQKQRVNISIAQVFYNKISLPVKIDLYDNDGYLGLYVPGSNFREFSKQIGTQATQGLSQVSTPDNSDVRMNLLSQVFNTTTTTLTTLIKKDKALLKYNYVVYLKENKYLNN